ncbi:hypothetical protein HK414_18565 [Ramlibacter terrae]|uniref:DUF397 domain-containing protein n=1 Tax=Ramlibacter terrae TaxID=2732511 RepID=A0ABX6P460_9BURK|nr:hypothetical protein HK414_18565 [Ramlibacter terrae]
MMVGAAPDDMGFPVLARPLQWARLLQALEDTVTAAGGSAAQQEPAGEGTLPLARSHSGAGRASPPPPRRRPTTPPPRSARWATRCWWSTTTRRCACS